MSAWQASRAKSSARAAADAVDKVQNLQDLTELVGLRRSCDAVTRSFTKYQSRADGYALAGARVEDDIEALRELMVEAKRHRHLFNESGRSNPADAFFSKAESSIRVMSKMDTRGDDRQGALDVWLALADFSSHLQVRVREGQKDSSEA